MPLAKDTGYPVKSLQNLPVTYTSVAPASAGQLVGWDGALVVAAATPIQGVLMDDAAQNQTVSVGMVGLFECIAGGAITAGALIGADASGRGIAVGAGTQSIGRARTATTAAGQKFQLFITREGTN